MLEANYLPTQTIPEYLIMKMRSALVFLFLLFAYNTFAQDTSFVTRKLFYGLSGSWLTTHTARKAPEVTGSMLLPYVGSTRVLDENLLYAYPLNFHAAFPYQKHWEIAFRFGYGIGNAERIRATATALGVNASGNVYVSDFAVERERFNAHFFLFQFCVFRDLIDRERIMAGIGPGFQLSRNSFETRAKPQMCVQMPVQVRLMKSLWLEVTPTFSLYMSGVHVGLEKSIEVKRRPKPHNWYIRTFNDED